MHSNFLLPRLLLLNKSFRISIVQDLVCVRQIQSGEYAVAIKLDQQIPSTKSGAPWEREKIVDEVCVRVIPYAERAMVNTDGKRDRDWNKDWKEGGDVLGTYQFVRSRQH